MSTPNPPGLSAGLGLASTLSLSAGLASAGSLTTDGIAASSTVAFGVIVVAALAGYGGGRLVERDPDERWAPSPGLVKLGLAALGVALLFVAPFAAAVAVAPLVSGYLSGRGSVHASDVTFGGVALGGAVAALAHGKALEAGLLPFVPLALVAVALVARDAWDLAHLARVARRNCDPLASGGAAPTPSPSRTASREAARGVAVVGVGAALAAAVALSRETLIAAYVDVAAPGMRNFVVGLFLASIAAIVWLFRLPKKAPPTLPPYTRRSG